MGSQVRMNWKNSCLKHFWTRQTTLHILNYFIILSWKQNKSYHPFSVEITRTKHLQGITEDFTINSGIDYRLNNTTFLTCTGWLRGGVRRLFSTYSALYFQELWKKFLTLNLTGSMSVKKSTLQARSLHWWNITIIRYICQAKSRILCLETCTISHWPALYAYLINKYINFYAKCET